MHGYKWPINCTRTRTEQSLELVQHARLLHRLSGGASVVVAGDFNATPDLVEYEAMLAGGLLDSFLVAGIGNRNTWMHTQNRLCQTGAFTGEDCVMDYIFVLLPTNQHVLRCRQSEVVCREQPWLSDHFGVRLSFSLAKR